MREIITSYLFWPVYAVTVTWEKELRNKTKLTHIGRCDRNRRKNDRTLVKCQAMHTQCLKIAKIRKGKASPVCKLSGGYNVHPPAGAPPSIHKVERSIENANGIIQKLQLFILGKAISGPPIIIGIIQLAKPVNAGITTPKIITRACIVVIELKN